MYIIANSYIYYQKTVVKPGHPAIMYVYYELVFAVITPLEYLLRLSTL